MTDLEWKIAIEANERARAEFASLGPEGRKQRLIEIGILDANGRLSVIYGGPGESTDPDFDPRTPGQFEF